MFYYGGRDSRGAVKQAHDSRLLDLGCKAHHPLFSVEDEAAP